jgi:hypothetical protein
MRFPSPSAETEPLIAGLDFQKSIFFHMHQWIAKILRKQGNRKYNKSFKIVIFTCSILKTSGYEKKLEYSEIFAE